MVAAVRLLPFEHLPCTAHSLQRTVTVSLQDSGFESVLAKCCVIVGHFKHSPSNAQELNEQQLAHRHKQESLAQGKMEFHPGDGQADPENKSPLTKLFIYFCRYINELLGGEQYVSCSVLLPAYRHLFKVMEPSDLDPMQVVRFKKVFTTDLTQRKNSTNLTWLKIASALEPRFKDLKCLPKEERCEAWASVRGQVTQQPPAVTTEKQSLKKRKMSIFLLGSSDT